jgi:hypothetical protein
MPPQLPRLAGAELGKEPLAVQEAVRAFLETLAQQVETIGAPTPVVSDTHRAKAGELVLVDPTKAAFTVWLPKISRDVLGQFVRVKNASDSANEVTIQPADVSATIDGQTSVILSKARGGSLFVAGTPELWVEFGAKERGMSYAYAYADLYTSAATTIAAYPTFTVLTVDTNDGGLKDFTLAAATCKLTYTGTITKKFNLQCNASFELSVANKLFHVGFSKNGTILPTHVDHHFSVANDHAAVSFGAVVSLATDDYIDVRGASSQVLDVEVEHLDVEVTEAD